MRSESQVGCSSVVKDLVLLRNNSVHFKLRLSSELGRIVAVTALAAGGVPGCAVQSANSDTPAAGQSLLFRRYMNVDFTS